MAAEYEVREGKDGELAIFLKNWNVRVATFENGVSEPDKEEIAKLLKTGWKDAPNVELTGSALLRSPS